MPRKSYNKRPDRHYFSMTIDAADWERLTTLAAEESASRGANVTPQQLVREYIDTCVNAYRPTKDFFLGTE